MDTRLETSAILRDFHKITGARISLHDIDYNEIAAYPKRLNPFCECVRAKEGGEALCRAKDAEAFEIVKRTEKAYSYTCHCGLIETVAPIFHYGVLTGYFMMGQITGSTAEDSDRVKSLSRKFFETETELSVIMNSIPKIDNGSIQSYINILKIIAEYMTRTNRIIPIRRELAENVKRYVGRHYSEDISIDSLCLMFDCSRTTLMKSFKQKYGITLGEYIKRYRLTEAENLLRTTTRSIKEISAECGFSDQNYFSKVFAKGYNYVPSAYRKRFK